MVKIAKGENVFGRKTRQGACLYYVLEEHFDFVIDDFRKYGTVDLPIFIRKGRLPYHTFLPILRRDVTETGAVFAVADPLFDVLDVLDESKYVQINTALKEIVDVVRSLPVHVTFLHHANKSGVRSMSAILGSRAIEGATDVNVMIERREDGIRTVYSVPRYGEEIPLSKLVMEKDTRELRVIERRAG
jgi:RecA-family ATPase